MKGLNSDEGTDTVVLLVFMYFVIRQFQRLYEHKERFLQIRQSLCCSYLVENEAKELGNLCK